jgi:acetoacetyl-CoA synthetase
MSAVIKTRQINIQRSRGGNVTDTRIKEGEVLWEPTAAQKTAANLSRFQAWLRAEKKLTFDGYHDLWAWSVDRIEDFWEAIWDYFTIDAAAPYRQVLSQRAMPGGRWFPGARLNYAEHVFRQSTPHRPALKFRSEVHPLREVSWQELYDQVAGTAAFLRRSGIRPGDRVVAYMPNIPETVVIFLACASVGAVWSCCSPDFAGRSVIDRFRQIEPKVLFCVDEYVYGGRTFNCGPAMEALQKNLPTLEKVVVVPYREPLTDPAGASGEVTWNRIVDDREPLVFEPVPFSHPLWVVYSSGTTGKPKGLVHSQGGILLEFLKFLTFHLDLRREDTFFWYSTTGWVMWNIVQGGLLTGAVPLLYDGHPAYPDLYPLWAVAEEAKISFFGTSAAFITACMQARLQPGKRFNLQDIRAVGSTGSPLSPDGFKWIYDHVHADLVLGSTAGGTDVCTGFMGACPVLPVRAGELQCRCLGVNAQAWDDQGAPLENRVGELVITRPMPSMPLHLWNDADGSLYRESYFELYPGVWRHGDWVRFTPSGGCVIQGRSDSTLNRQGVRMGSSDFYNVLEEMEEISDCLIVGVPDRQGDYRIVLFVVPGEGSHLGEDLKTKINTTLRVNLSPRHIPDRIVAAPEIPRTLNGKKLEVPVIRILAGAAAEEAVNRDAMSNPEAIEFFLQFAEKM